MNTSVGKSIHRKEAWDKVCGRAQYVDDIPLAGALSARLLTSTCAHARIKGIDLTKALSIPGVQAIVTGGDCSKQFGPLLQDRPALAREVVRYAGEPVAMAIAVDEATAEQAVRLIQVQYEPLPVLLSPSQALAPDAPLVHKQGNGYKKVMEDIYPEGGSNVASRYQVRKGEGKKALEACETVVEKRFYLPPSDHVAMEVRSARCEIATNWDVILTTTSQAPFSVQTQIASAFLIPSGKVQVKVPFVGGGFGGKAAVSLEILAYLASQRVGGKAVRLTIPREQDMASTPSRLGLEAVIKLGADKEGRLQAADLTYYLDCGAYSDSAPYMTKAIAVDCTGPYRVEHLTCDAVCVYTNRTYATSFRGFAHESYTFCVERTMDILAKACGKDPLEFRLLNAIRPGDLTPTQVCCTNSLMGDLPGCLTHLKSLGEWEGAKPIQIKADTVRAQGVSCFWKTENPPTDAVSGALITCNEDGSLNLHTGVVEMGSGGQTHLAQILAEKFKIDAQQIHVVMEVDTRVSPEHWKTVASLTEYMAGNAVLQAADDLLKQFQRNGALALGCQEEEIEVSHGRVYSIKNPEQFIAWKDIVKGYKTPSGTSLGEPILGRGGFMLKGLCLLDPVTGRGKTGPDWTVGAQIVEVEADLKRYTYRILRATTVMDVGKVINPESMRSMVAGGMAMGISLASRECCSYDEKGIPQAPNLRTYKMMHIGQEPDYRVGFLETPKEDSPYGVRSYAEHGILGIPAALGNALSSAFQQEFCSLPITPEMIWTMAKEREA